MGISMNTQQLESFVQVAENLNFARAAEVLNITQSAVSRQINSLEEELGVRLFNRSTRTVSLTPAGISFLEDTRDVLARLQTASMKLRSQTGSSIQVLSIACSNEANLIYLTELLARCRQQFPTIHPFVRIIPHRSLLNLFLHGEIDILFGFLDDIPSRSGIRYRQLARIPVCCAFPDRHPYAKKAEIKEEELLSERLIVCNSFEIPSSIASIQNRLNHQFLPDSSYYCENLQVMLSLVRAGYGFCVLPAGASRDSGVCYVPLSAAQPLSYGVFSKTSAKDPIVRSFLSLLNAPDQES